MRYRHSLRFRIILSFLAVGGVIGPLLGMSLFVAIYELESRLIGQQVADELRHFVELNQQDPDITELRSSQLSGYVGPIGEPVTEMPILAELGAGMHEIEENGRTYYIGVTEQDGKRYYIVYDITEFEAHEHYLIAVLIGGTLLTVYVAVWLGYWLSRHLIAPVTSLAEQVRALQPDHASDRLAVGYADDEVGELARSFDAYTERLRAFVQRERDFTADASHELRNPLAVIQSATELLLSRKDLPAGLRTPLERIDRAAWDMAQSLSALLVLARESAAETSRDAVTEVADVVRRAVDLQRPLLDNDTVELDVILAASPRLAAPANVVAILVGNLIRNAFSYTRQGRATIRLEDKRLLVEDTGIGIEAGDLDRVFRRGFRGSGAPGEGGGLGLALAKRICDRYGWTLQIDSEAGIGTRVEWRFGFDGNSV